MKNYERNTTRVGCLNLMAIQKTPWRKAGYTLSLTHTNSPLSSSSLLFSLSFHPILLLFSLLSISFSLFSLSLLFSSHLISSFSLLLIFHFLSALISSFQRCGSISFWRESGSGSWDQHLGIVDPDPRIHFSGILDPDPRIHFRK